MEYGSRVLIRYRLAAVHLSELRFGKFSHLWFGKLGRLKDGSQSCLTQSNPQESVNLQSFKNRIHDLVFSRYTQHSGNTTSWCQGGVNFQVFPELHPLDLIRRLTTPYQIFSCKLSHLLFRYFEINDFSWLGKYLTSTSNAWNYYICIYVYICIKIYILRYIYIYIY